MRCHWVSSAPDFSDLLSFLSLFIHSRLQDSILVFNSPTKFHVSRNIYESCPEVYFQRSGDNSAWAGIKYTGILWWADSSLSSESRACITAVSRALRPQNDGKVNDWSCFSIRMGASQQVKYSKKPRWRLRQSNCAIFITRDWLNNGGSTRIYLARINYSNRARLPPQQKSLSLIKSVTSADSLSHLNPVNSLGKFVTCEKACSFQLGGSNLVETT